MEIALFILVLLSIVLFVDLKLRHYCGVITIILIINLSIGITVDYIDKEINKLRKELGNNKNHKKKIKKAIYIELNGHTYRQVK